MREIDPSLQRAIESLAVPGLLVGCRLISFGDEDALTPEETASINSSLPAVRRASGAARIVARQLMQWLGLPSTAILKDSIGMPIWPEGFAGSLAHDDSVAVATVARSMDFRAVGIDIEPAAPLPADMHDLVMSARERDTFGPAPLAGRVVFVAKEAAYKAVYPLDHVFLEFSDIEIDLAAGKALTRTGRTLSLLHCIASHIVALAFA
jgi:4'-phosphopantetheinyl transferase EntD